MTRQIGSRSLEISEISVMSGTKVGDDHSGIKLLKEGIQSDATKIFNLDSVFEKAIIRLNSPAITVKVSDHVRRKLVAEICTEGLRLPVGIRERNDSERQRATGFAELMGYPGI